MIDLRVKVWGMTKENANTSVDFRGKGAIGGMVVHEAELAEWRRTVVEKDAHVVALSYELKI